MIALPVKLITEIDQPLFGVSLLNLAKLERLGFPVVSGVAVCAPEMVLNTVLKHTQNGDREVFEQKLTVIKNDLLKIKIPDEVEKLLKGHKIFYLQGQLFTREVVIWQNLLAIWLEEIRARFWRGGFTQGITRGLSAQAVFFTPKQFFEGSAFYEPNLSDVVIKCDVELAPETAQQIDKMVVGANKKLFLPQNYKFLIAGKKAFLIGISPFTQNLPASQVPQVFIPKEKQAIAVKSAVKLFLNMSSGFALASKLDGILIEGEKMKNFDEAVFKLAEAALTLHQCPVIYKLPDVAHLIHQKAVLDEAAKIFLFVRNKKNIANVELAIPLTRSAEELLQVKRELAVREITRKGALRIWWEAAVPENLINIENYLEAGIDGVILNLDSLQQLIGGYQAEEGEMYTKQIQALVKFIDPVLKILHKAKIPVLVKGELAANTDIINWLIRAGVFGLVINSLVEAEHLPEYLGWVEKRLVAEKLYEG